MTLEPASLPSAVLFDMDGTLVDTEGLWFESEIAVMAGLGAAWTAADQEHCLGGPLERVAEYMLSLSGADVAPDVVGARLLDEMESRLRSRELEWRPGARDLLEQCRTLAVPTALVSASWSRLIVAVGEKVEADLGRPAFDAIVAGDDVEFSKPHPEPYLTAAAALGHVPSACLAIEDSPTGVRSAVAAGCRVIAVPHLASIDVDGAVVVQTLEGLSLGALWEKTAASRASSG